MGTGNAFRKDVTREIANTFSRFLAIFAIVALGLAFFAGIGATGRDMKITGNEYFGAQRLMDLRVVSTYGLTDKDVAAIAGAPGVQSVHPAYSIDAQTTRRGHTLLLKVHSVADGVNLPRVVEGRMPEKDDEAVVEGDFLSSLGYGIGDSFTLDSGKKQDMRLQLKNVRYTVTGVVESPYYISRERGSSSIGSGRVDCFILIPEANFRQSVYSEAFVSVAGASAPMCFSQQYKDLVGLAEDGIKAAGEERSAQRHLELTWAARTALDEAEEEVARQLAQAEAEAELALAQIDGARAQIETARSALAARGSEAAAGAAEAVAAEGGALAGIAELDAALAEAEAQAGELGASIAEIDDAAATLSQKNAALSDADALARAADAAARAAGAAGAADAGDPAGAQGATAQGAGAQGSAAQGLAAQGAAAEGVRAARRAIEAVAAELEASRALAEDGLRQAMDARSELQSMRAQAQGQLAGIEVQKAAIVNAQVQIQQGLAAAAAEAGEIDRQAALLAAMGESARLEAGAALASIEASRESIKDIDPPEWYVLDRDTNPGYSAYSEDSSKIEAIGTVFPAIFFVVAALVCLTTMTRLVEEKRVEIGTLKSLGYGNLRIMSKYAAYAAAPTLLGGILGGYVGMKLFPVTIIGAYTMMYSIPSPSTPIDARLWATGIAFAAVSTLTATAVACMNELRSAPAALMRPRAPKLGKRIVLERIAPLWRLMTFIQKVTARNILRYRKRFYMTVIGVAGCTALLITGFGLRDSIMSMLTLQYGAINRYDLLTSFTDSAKPSDVGGVDALYAKSPAVMSSATVRQKRMDAGAGPLKSAEYPADLIVAKDADTLASFITLRDRATGAAIPLGSDSAVISEKLARLLGVGPGDTFYVSDGDSVRTDLVVGGVAEMYYMHYIYIDSAYYRQAFGEAAEPNAVVTRLAGELGIAYGAGGAGANGGSGSGGSGGSGGAGGADGSGGSGGVSADLALQTVVADVLEKKGVASVLYSSSILDSFRDVVSNLNFVVLVLIVSAAALAFVVLLNLTNININERIRELATIEVLGFYDKEVSAYVYRENAALTAIGIAAGLALGIILHRYVILTAETEPMMFGRDIKLASFIYSALLTMAFSVFVNIITAAKLRRINMVEALKSME